MSRMKLWARGAHVAARLARTSQLLVDVVGFGAQSPWVPGRASGSLGIRGSLLVGDSVWGGGPAVLATLLREFRLKGSHLHSQLGALRPQLGDDALKVVDNADQDAAFG